MLNEIQILLFTLFSIEIDKLLVVQKTCRLDFVQEFGEKNESNLGVSCIGKKYLIAQSFA